MFRVPSSLTVFVFSVAVLCTGAALANESVPSLVAQEIVVGQAICEGEVAKALADYQHAAWKLEQLTKLRSRGHASWQEVARQQTKTASLKAGHEAATEHLVFVNTVRSQFENLAADNVSRDSEAIRLFMPGSARLVGWLPAKHTSRDLVSRQLHELKTQMAQLEAIDTSGLAEAVSKFQQHIAKLQATNNSAHAHLLRRSQVELQGVIAEQQLATAHKASAEVLKQRIALLENEIAKRDEGEAESIALFGTPLVSASNNETLSTLTHRMVHLEANATKPLELLRQLESNQHERIDALETLSQHHAANPEELKAARQQLADIQAAIQQQRQIILEQKQLASLHNQRNPDGLRKEGPLTNESDPFAGVDKRVLTDATAVRHILELNRKLASIKAARTSAVADMAYLQERSDRIANIAEKHRSRNELAGAKNKVFLARGRIESIDATIVLLTSEVQRFVAQCQAQHDGNFQLVQVAEGRFVNRLDLAEQEAILSSVAMLRSGANQRSYCGYLESSNISRYYNSLATNIQPRASATEAADLLASGQLGYSAYRAGARSSVFQTRLQPRGLRLATDGISYPSDLFNYIPSDLWQLYPGYRSYRSFGYRGYGYVPVTYSRGIGRYASRSYGSTNFGSSYYGSQNYSSGLAYGSYNGGFSFYGAYDPAAASRFYSRIPRYSDYYSFGIRRYDSPAGSSFRRGSRAFSPFYIPGSPTNFRY